MRQVNTSLPPEMVEEVDDMVDTKREYVSRADFIRRAINNQLNRDNEDL